MIKRLKLVICVLLISVSWNSAYSQNTSVNKDSSKVRKNVGDIIAEDFKISFNDGIRTFVSPFHYDSKDAIIAAVVISTTALLFTVDDETRTYFQKQKSSFNDALKDVGNLYGNVYPTLIIGGGLYTTGLFAGNDNLRITGRMVIESFAIAGLITTLTKSALGRHRPYTNDGPAKFEGPTIDNDFLSLPSGHATVAFALSTTLANRIHNTYASIGLYSLAGITALARIYDDKHWASDVFLGSAIGYFVGDFISGKKNKNNKYHIVPTSNGLSLIYNL